MQIPRSRQQGPLRSSACGMASTTVSTRHVTRSISHRESMSRPGSGREPGTIGTAAHDDGMPAPVEMGHRARPDLALRQGRIQGPRGRERHGQLPRHQVQGRKGVAILPCRCVRAVRWPPDRTPSRRRCESGSGRSLFPIAAATCALGCWAESRPLRGAGECMGDGRPIAALGQRRLSPDRRGERSRLRS